MAAKKKVEYFGGETELKKGKSQLCIQKNPSFLADIFCIQKTTTMANGDSLTCFGAVQVTGETIVLSSNKNQMKEDPCI